MFSKLKEILRGLQCIVIIVRKIIKPWQIGIVAFIRSTSNFDIKVCPKVTDTGSAFTHFL